MNEFERIKTSRQIKRDNGTIVLKITAISVCNAMKSVMEVCVNVSAKGVRHFSTGKKRNRILKAKQRNAYHVFLSHCKVRSKEIRRDASGCAERPGSTKGGAVAHLKGFAEGIDASKMILSFEKGDFCIDCVNSRILCLMATSWKTNPSPLSSHS